MGTTGLARAPLRRARPPRITILMNALLSRRRNALTVLKALVSVALVGGALVYLLGGSLESSLVYDRTVDQVVSEPQTLTGQLVRVGGRLQAGSHLVVEQTTEHRFTLQGESHTLPVRFNGSWPDAATEERELMVEGRLTPDGFVEAHRVLARCPSRYKRRVSPNTDNAVTPSLGATVP